MSTTTPSTPPTQQYWQDRQWIHDHGDQLVGDHPNEWIAVHCGRVLASGPDLGLVQDAARAQCSAADIVFQFMDDGSIIF